MLSQLILQHPTNYLYRRVRNNVESLVPLTISSLWLLRELFPNTVTSGLVIKDLNLYQDFFVTKSIVKSTPQIKFNEI